MPENCMLCKEEATIGVRGTIQKDYAHFCSFHAGAIQMILEILHVNDEVKWRPLYEKLFTSTES